jgi:hypothetical protein
VAWKGFESVEQCSDDPPLHVVWIRVSVMSGRNFEIRKLEEARS